MNTLNNKPRVLLSVVTWNHAKNIGSTIDSIFSQTYDNFQTVVFDNNSYDGTLEILQAYGDKVNFHLIKNEENIGFCGGHNYILKNYSFDYVILVNPDIILNPDYIEQTLKAFEIDSQIGAVCGLLTQSFDKNPVIDSMGMQLVKSRRFILINHGLHLNAVQITSGYVGGLDGALPAFKKEAVDSLLINGEFFNPLFFSHKEDWDVSWRLILFDWKIYFNKESIAIHPRVFKPSKIRERLRINHKIKFDAFKNQFLLLLINEDRVNFIRDSIIIIPRIFITTLFCLFFERRSLRAFSYVIENRKRIFLIRKEVQERRKISCSDFRKYLNA